MIHLQIDEGGSVSYRLQLTEGSLPADCRLVNAPAGFSIDATHEIKGGASLSPGTYSMQAVCANCAGDSEPVDIELVVRPVVSLDCQDATPPGTVKQIFATPSNPIVVPQNFIGLHLAETYLHWQPQNGAPMPPVAYPYRIARSLSAITNGYEERSFWSNIERSPGVYTWDDFDDWVALLGGRPFTFMIYGTPQFYSEFPGERTPFSGNASWLGIGAPPRREHMDKLAAFVTAVKARYGGQIANFELWNEIFFRWDVATSDTSDASRVTAAWANSTGINGGNGSFYTGSATQYVNMAATVKQVVGGTPLLVGAFQSPGEKVVTRVANAHADLPGHTGSLASYADGVSVHFYDFSNTQMNDLYAAIDQYKAELGASFAGMPITLTEGGNWTPGQPIAATGRYFLIAALKGLQGAYAYGHLPQEDGSHFGDGINGPQVTALMQNLDSLNGAVICNGALLHDGRSWAVTQSGETFLY